MSCPFSYISFLLNEEKGREGERTVRNVFIQSWALDDRQRGFNIKSLGKGKGTSADKIQAIICFPCFYDFSGAYMKWMMRRLWVWVKCKFFHAKEISIRLRCFSCSVWNATCLRLVTRIFYVHVSLYFCPTVQVAYSLESSMHVFNVFLSASSG